MHKCFVGPLTSNSIKAYITRLKDDGDRAKLVLQHRCTLAQSCIDVLATTRDLHALLGGGPHRYFVISVAMIEASAMLGMMIISDLLLSTLNHNVALLERDLLLSCHASFQEGFKLLQVLAQNSVLAQKGVRVLEGFDQRITRLEALEVGKCAASENNSDHNNTTNTTKYADVRITDDYQIHTDLRDNVGLSESSFHSADTALLQPTFVDLEWENVCAGNDISCFLEDWNSFGDGSIPDLFEIGGSFI